MSLSDDLRELADLVDARPELGLSMGGNTLVFAKVDGSFIDAVRGLTALKLGSVAKDRGEKMAARVRLNKTFELIALDYRDEVACELVQTGTRTVERPVYADEPIRVDLVEEPIMEWVCPPSILADAS